MKIGDEIMTVDGNLGLIIDLNLDGTFKVYFQENEDINHIYPKELKVIPDKEKQELLGAAKKALNAINKLNAKVEPTGQRPISNKVAYKLIEAIQKAEGDNDEN